MPERTYSSSNYRFGFNSQEKSDIAEGHTTAGFWEYSSRAARRWNVDPRGAIYFSPFSVLGGNPVLNVDPYGDTTRFYNNSGNNEYLGMLVDGDHQHSVRVDKDFFDKMNEKYDFKKVNSLGDAGTGQIVLSEMRSVVKMYARAKGVDESLVYNLVGWWGTIDDVAEGQEWIPYEFNCFDSAKEQTIQGGGDPTGPGSAIHLYIEEGASLSVNVPLAMAFTDASLVNGNPVLTGVNYSQSYHPGNVNILTDHFVAIVGRGNDQYGNYYTYIDNAYDGWDLSLNRFYYNSSTKALINPNSNHRMTEIRPNKNTNVLQIDGNALSEFNKERNK